MSKSESNASVEEQKVQDFFIAVLKDEALRERFMATLDAKDSTAIMAMACDRGYHFSRESLRQELKSITNLIAPIALMEQ